LSAQRWLIIEAQFEGHHYTYLERVVEGILERGHTAVIGLSRDDHGIRNREALIRRFGASCLAFVTVDAPTPCRVPGAIPRLICQEVRRRAFFKAVYREAARTARVDFVFLPYFDWALFATAMFGSPFGDSPFAGIVMGLRLHFAKMGIRASHDALGRYKALLFQRLLAQRRLIRIFTIDETLPEYARNQKLHGADKVVYFADPADPASGSSRVATRAALHISHEACIVLVYGFLDARKGIDRLVRWLVAPTTPRNVVLLAVGLQSDDVAELLNSEPMRSLANEGRVRMERRFVSDAEEAGFFDAADIVWVAYTAFDFMSGVVVRAAQHHRGIIFDDRGLIGRFARKYAVAPADQNSCAAVYRSLPQDLTAAVFVETTALPDHSWANMKRILFS
jgi:hypothetical protein